MSESANKAGETKEIKPLTGIRGVAAAMVIQGHFHGAWTMLLPSLHRLDYLTACGGLGVDLFFLLSGFILSYVYKSGPASRLGMAEYRGFIWLRFARVWPNHVATLAALALMVLLARLKGTQLTGEYPPGGIPFQLTMTHAWPFIPYGPWGWNYPSWSISAEWFAYLFIFPVAWRLLEFKLKPPLWLVLCYTFLSLWLLVLNPIHNQSLDIIGRVVMEFLAGAMLFNTFRRSESITRACQKYVLAVVLACLALMGFVPKDNLFAYPAIILIFPLILLGLTSGASRPAKFLAWPPMLWLGRISFALYMTHGIVQKILKVFLPPEHFQNSTLAVRLGIVSGEILIILLAGAALYYLIEVPSRHYLRHLAALWKARTRLPKSIQPD